MDAHLTLPRTECLAVAALIRASGPLPRPASPADYERVLRPIYGFSFGVAQARARVSRPQTPALGGGLEGALRQRRATARPARG